jgi:hypothetical protein
MCANVGGWSAAPTARMTTTLDLINTSTVPQVLSVPAGPRHSLR